MRNPLRRKSITGTAEVQGAIDQGWTATQLLGAGARQRIEDAYRTAQSASLAWLYLKSPAVRTVIDTIVTNVGQLPLRLYEEIAVDQREARPEHPAALSLRYPNEVTAQDAFIRQLFKDKLIFDNAYAAVTNAPGGQINLNWIPTQHIEVLGSSLFVIDKYRFWRPEGWSYVDIRPEGMLHWRGENPTDPRVGASKLDTLREIIAEDVALAQANTELANAGLQEPVWIGRPLEAPDWTPQASQNFTEEMANRLRRKNRLPVVLEEGMELHSFGVSPRDAQMYDIRKFVIERIAAAYNVPLGMVGLEPVSEEARSQFMADTLPPYCKDFCSMLNQRILVRGYNWTQGCFEFDLDEKLMGDTRIQTLVTASGRAVMTTDEARARLNLPPAPKGIGKDLVTPLNVLVGENPKPSPNTMGPQAPGGPAQDGSARGTLPSEGGPPSGSPATPATNTGKGDFPQDEYDVESTAEEVAFKTEVEVPVDIQVQQLLERLYDRQEKAWRNRKTFSVERFSRELTADLTLIAPSLDQKAATMASYGLNDAVKDALEHGGDCGLIFAKARRGSAGLARKFVVSCGMDPKALRDLGMPDEMVWEAAGMSTEQIDRMRTINYAAALSNGSDDFEEKAFDSAAHPRAPAGGATGGQFITAGSNTQTDKAAAEAKRRLGGKLTEEAIRAFQKRHHIQVDGVIGKQTAAALLGSDHPEKLKPGPMTAEQRKGLEGLLRQVKPQARGQLVNDGNPAHPDTHPTHDTMPGRSPRRRKPKRPPTGGTRAPE